MSRTHVFRGVRLDYFNITYFQHFSLGQFPEYEGELNKNSQNADDVDYKCRNSRVFHQHYLKFGQNPSNESYSIIYQNNNIVILGFQVNL